jgi:hypothetical protein
MIRRTAVAASALALAASAAPLPLAGAATSDATFKKQANAACTTAGRQIEALPEVTDDNAVQTLTKTAKIARSLVKKLKAIDPPKAKAAKYQQFVKVNADQATVADDLIKAIKAKETAKVKSLTKKIDKAGDRSDALAKSLGLDACAKPVEPGGSDA